MILPEFSVKRPIFTTMITLIVVILGIFSLTRLKIDLLPSIELPTLSVRTQYEGADPVVMEQLVSQVIEEIVATIPGVEEMTSESSEGNSTVRVRFAWGTDIDAAALEVQAKLEDDLNELPDEIVRPRVNKFDIDSFPVMILGISSPLDPVATTQLIEDQVRYRFGRLAGVAEVDLWGEFKREIRVQLDPGRIIAQGVSLQQIVEVLRNANLDLPAGQIEQGGYELRLRAPAEFEDLEQIRTTVIAEGPTGTVRLGDVARIVDTYEKPRRLVRVNGERGLRIGIRKQDDANTVEVARGILAEIDDLKRDFPQLSIVPVINQGNFIERSIANVVTSVLYGGGLSLLVLLFFLRNLRSTLVIALAIPISVIATFTLIFFGGFTLNLMTLGGLALGVGMMVDSSIVVLENIFRRRTEQGEDPVSAAIRGASEVGPAIVASTITTLVIFLPLVFVRGVAGVLFQEMAFVIIFALVCSLLVSLSLLPMLASRLLESVEQLQVRRRSGPLGGMMRAAEQLFSGLDRGYRDLLRSVLRRPAVTVVCALFLLGGSLLLLPLIGSEFLPPSDEGEVRVTGEMDIGTRLDLLDRQARILEERVYSAVPEAVSGVISVGSSSWRARGVARADMRLALSSARERERANTEIAADLRRRLEGTIPGMTIRTRAPQGQFLLQRLLGSEEGLTVEVRGFDFATLDLLARQVVDRISGIAGITDVDSDREAGMPQQRIRIDREKVADLGLTARDVAEMLQTAIAGRKAGEFRSAGNTHRILVQLENAEQRSLEEILDLPLIVEPGHRVALRNLVTTEEGRGPIVINRSEQQRLVSIDVNVAGRDLGSVAADIDNTLRGIARPVGYDLLVAGSYAEQQEAFRELVFALVLALLLVYMVLACQYESLRDPLVVMASVPVAAVGVLLILFLTGTTLNLQSYIGCIMLGGIVVNNAILLVDQTGQLVRSGLDVRSAVAEAGRRRLRPILMTSLTTVLALLPLALGIGEGADAQAPLARAVVGGLSGSTLLTLVLIPAVYVLFHRHARRS